MNIKEITVTSKNQVTLPADFVRTMGISKSRVLTAELRNNSIVLTVQPKVSTSMMGFWNKHHSTKTHSDAQLKQAIRSSVGNKK